MGRLGIGAFRSPAIDDPALAEIVRRLSEAYRPETIYLFGSTAGGTPAQTATTT
jgi:hypothetical protein